MKRLHKSVGGISGIQLTLLLICVLSTTALPSTDRVQTYVSRSSWMHLASDGPSSFLLAQHQEDSIRVHTLDSLKLKDPNMALLYAVIPGVVIHGSGHFYAGKTKTGAVLLVSGAVGGTIFYYGLWGKGSFQAFGGFLFFGSWIYDLVGAPHAVQRENQEFLQGRNVRLRFDLDHTSHSVRVQIVKRF